MSASRYKDRHETEQEETELAEQAAHEAGECRGYPYCYECIAERDIDDMVDHVNNELDKEKKRA